MTVGATDAGWWPICRPCWQRDHDRCRGGEEFCVCICPCYWQPDDPQENP